MQSGLGGHRVGSCHIQENPNLRKPHSGTEGTAGKPAQSFPLERHHHAGQETDLPSALVARVSSKVVCYIGILEICKDKNCHMMYRNIM